MASLLQPSYTLNLGSQQWTKQVLRLALKLGTAPLVDILEVRLPAAAAFTASIGDPVELTLHNGEKDTVVFTGISCRKLTQIYSRIKRTLWLPASAVNRRNAGVRGLLPSGAFIPLRHARRRRSGRYRRFARSGVEAG